MNSKDLVLYHVGKVRDTYIHPDVKDLLVIVATDRISAFDVLMTDGVLDKGRVLTAMSDFWFRRLAGIVRTQNYGATDIELSKAWTGRTTFAVKAEMFPVECVVRGYLAGSGLKDYKSTSALFGNPQPAGLRLGSKLTEPLFTPTTKAQSGHDEPMTMGEVYDLIGKEAGDELKRLSIELYSEAEATCSEAGIVLADTKFEFGLVDGSIVLCDEVLTPDSSRFWESRSVTAGSPVQYDKQILRDWLEEVGWDKKSIPPQLPVQMLASLSIVYREIYEKLTGLSLDDWPGASSSAYLGERDLTAGI